MVDSAIHVSRSGAKLVRILPKIEPMFATPFLCVTIVVTPLFFFIGRLPTPGVTSGAFDQYQYIFTFLENGLANLEMDFVLLDRTTGGIIMRNEVTRFIDRTTNPLNMNPSRIALRYRGGDIAIDCDKCCTRAV